MDQNPEAENQRSKPYVQLPVALFNVMCLCFYGEGPRFWELGTKGGVAESPRNDGLEVKGGVSVPPIPPHWKRVNEEPDANAV